MKRKILNKILFCGEFLVLLSVPLFAQAQEALHDIRPPIALPFRFMLVIILLLIAAVLCTLFVLYMRRRKCIVEKEEVEEKLPPAEVALRKLQELKLSAFLEKGMFKKYFTILSDTVRQYIEGQFDVSAPDMTTEEFLLFIRKDGVFAKEHMNLLHEFLQGCDMVKFAKYGPSKTEAEEAFFSIERFVKETMPKEEVPHGNDIV